MLKSDLMKFTIQIKINIYIDFQQLKLCELKIYVYRQMI